MIIKSNSDELKDISKKLGNNTNSFYDEIKIWQEEIENLKTNWSGIDAEIFYKKIDLYLEQLLVLYGVKKELGDFIGLANEKYNEKDDEFYQEMKRENDIYEPKRESE